MIKRWCPPIQIKLKELSFPGGKMDSAENLGASHNSRKAYRFIPFLMFD